MARRVEEAAIREMVRLQEILMAHEDQGILVLFQGMDASGKDESIRDVLSHLDPRACEFKQFRRMTEKEARHDYLWRAALAMPARGQIGIFNRSYYEHVIGERVHPEKLKEQFLPDFALEDVWEKRFRHINNFERYLVENGIHILKFFLHVSKEEQRLRLLKRLEGPQTSWEFSSSDVEEREHWDAYMRFYGEAMTRTNTDQAPWYVIPGDHRWYSRAVVAAAIAERLRSMHTEYPPHSPEDERKLGEARKELQRQAPSC